MATENYKIYYTYNWKNNKLYTHEFSVIEIDGKEYSARFYPKRKQTFKDRDKLGIVQSGMFLILETRDDKLAKKLFINYMNNKRRDHLRQIARIDEWIESLREES